MNYSFESGGFGHMNKILNFYINTFNWVDENKIMMQIFYDLKDHSVKKKNLKGLIYYNYKN